MLFFSRLNVLWSIFLFLTILIWVGCNEAPNQVESPDISKKNIILGIPLSEVCLSQEEASMENPYMQAAAEIQERYTDELLSIEGVNAVGITLTKDRRIAFHIGTDYLATPETNHLLPKDLEGIPIIYRVAPVRISSQKSQVIDDPFQPSNINVPPQPGIPIGSYYNAFKCTYGTLGIYVEKWGSTTYLLTNNHVLAIENKLSPDTSVYIQSNNPSHGCRNNEKLAIESEIKRIDYSTHPFTENHIDAAIAKVTAPFHFRNKCFQTLPTKHPIIPRVGTPVELCGAVSWGVKGKIVSTNTNVVVNYDGSQAKFQELIGYDIATKNGDSGSLVVGNGAPVALHMGADGGVAYGCPIGKVLNHFGVSIKLSPIDSKSPSTNEIPEE